MLLINLARIFEAEADKQVPSPPSEPDNRDNCSEQKKCYWKNFLGLVVTHQGNRENQLINGKAAMELRSHMLNRMPLVWKKRKKCSFQKNFRIFNKLKQHVLAGK